MTSTLGINHPEPEPEGEEFNNATLPSFLLDSTKYDVVGRTPISTNLTTFDLIHLDPSTPFHYGPAFSPTQAGMFDGSLSRNGRSFRDLNQLADAQLQRSKTRQVKEFIMTRETIKPRWMDKPMDTPILPKQTSREFLLVTYNGFAQYLKRVFNEHVTGDVDRDFHRLACFHETLNYESSPMKLYLDLEYDPSKVREDYIQTLEDDSVLSYGRVLTEFKAIMTLIIERLELFWNEVFVAADPTKQLGNAKIRFMGLDSSRVPAHTTTANQTNATEGWKLSYHIIWFVEGVRFVEQDSLLPFFKAALAYIPESNGNARDEEMTVDDGTDPDADYSFPCAISDAQTSIHGLQIIDFQPFDSKAFRAPYNVKLECSDSGRLCPALAPDPEFMDPETLKLFTGAKFTVDLFFLGLIKHIPSPDDPSNLANANIPKLKGKRQLPANSASAPNLEPIKTTLKENVLYFIQSTDRSFNRSRVVARKFEEDIKAIFGNEEVLALMKPIPSRPTSTPQISSSLETQLAIDLATKDEELTIPQIIQEVTTELAATVSLFCMAKTGNKYGECSIQLKGLKYTAMPTNEVLCFRCYPSKNSLGTPCLARFHDSFKPHSKNYNYIILVVHSLKWYMCCHNFDCTRTFLDRNGIFPNSRAISDQVLKDTKTKAKSETFFITEQQPSLLFLVSTLSNKIRQYRMAEEVFNAKKQQLKKQRKEEQEREAANTLDMDTSENRDALATARAAAAAKEERACVDKMIDQLLDELV